MGVHIRGPLRPMVLSGHVLAAGSKHAATAGHCNRGSGGTGSRRLWTGVSARGYACMQKRRVQE